MESLARNIDGADVVQEVGIVRRDEEDAFFVDTSRGSYRARRAASCLLAPKEGDEVVVAALGDGRCYVLAVLERADASRAEIAIDGDLRLGSSNGRCTVAAPSGVEVVTGGEVGVTGGSLRLNVLDVNAVFERGRLLGKYLQSEVDKIRTVASTVDRVADRVTDVVKRAYRTVHEQDHLRAERVDYRAKGMMSLHADNAVVTADKLVKLDGEQVHVG